LTQSWAAKTQAGLDSRAGKDLKNTSLKGDPGASTTTSPTTQS